MSASASLQRRYNNRLQFMHLVFHYPDSPGKILQYQNEQTLRSDREENVYKLLLASGTLNLLWQLEQDIML